MSVHRSLTTVSVGPPEVLCNESYGQILSVGPLEVLCNESYCQTVFICDDDAESPGEARDQAILSGWQFLLESGGYHRDYCPYHRKSK